MRFVCPQLQSIVYNPKAHEIDYSRCVTCMDCIGKCKHGAITYTRRKPKNETATSEDTKAKSVTTEQVDNARRSFLSASAIFATTSVLKAQEKKVDGGLATIEDKKIPQRENSYLSSRCFKRTQFHSTLHSLPIMCVGMSQPGFRPSDNLRKLMQPEMSYERGYCRPECTKCSEVCPAGAIRPITKAEKSSVQIGHAVWVKKNVLPLTDGVECGNCARHCPTGAIQMVPEYT